MISVVDPDESNDVIMYPQWFDWAVGWINLMEFSPYPLNLYVIRHAGNDFARGVLMRDYDFPCKGRLYFSADFGRGRMPSLDKLNAILRSLLTFYGHWVQCCLCESRDDFRPLDSRDFFPDAFAERHLEECVGAATKFGSSYKVGDPWESVCGPFSSDDLE